MEVLARESLHGSFGTKQGIVGKAHVGSGAVKSVNGVKPDSAGNVEIHIPESKLQSVNGIEPDANGNVEIDTMPDGLEQISILAEADMLPAVHDASGSILTDENGNVILRY